MSVGRPSASRAVVFMTKVSKLFIDPDWELMIKYLQSCLGLAKDELKAPGLSDHQWRSEAAVRDMGSGENNWQLTCLLSLTNICIFD